MSEYDSYAQTQMSRNMCKVRFPKIGRNGKRNVRNIASVAAQLMVENAHEHCTF